MATPEKALLDLLYFHPEYKSDHDMENLRLDRDAMREEFDWKRFRAFFERFDNRALSQRAAVMENTYA
jgi:predicted transcriptional regulator of viral defense system